MATQTPLTVSVVDDDQSAREALVDLLESAGWTVMTFASAHTFLDQLRMGVPDCVVLDVKMPGFSGLELHKELIERVPDLPVVFVSGHGDIPTSVRAIKAGAREFLTKPYLPDELLEAVHQAATHGRTRREKSAERLKLRSRFDHLTEREKEVMKGVVAGRLNKQIAADLGISEITVKVHRRQLMQKMGAASLADLVRSAEALKSAPG